MKKFLLGTLGLVAMAAPAVAADLPARTYKAPPPMVAPSSSTTGPASISARTADMAGAIGASMSPLSGSSTSSLKVAITPGVASLVARSVTVGRPVSGCSVWKPKATGPISGTRASATSIRWLLGRPTPMHWVCSRVRLATPGMQVCFISRAALRSPNSGMIFSRRLVALELRRQNGQVGVARSVLAGNTASRRIGPPASNMTIFGGRPIPERC